MAVVVIDAGHGGTVAVGDSSPNNATSPSGLLEKNLTLEVARHAAAALIVSGHDVRMTRTTDVNLGLADRARVAKDARAEAFVSIHFNGFADPSVQGTETWVHLYASPASRELAAGVQGAVRLATRHRDRGLQAKRLGVLSPGRHHETTAACLAELSFITTADEDQRLQDPQYLRELGEALARGVGEYIGSHPSAASLKALTVRATTAANGPGVSNPKVPDVIAAFHAIPKKGKDAKFSGKVDDDGGGSTHIQGLAAYRDFHLITHSDEGKKSGRILVADRRADQQTLVGQFTLPVVRSSEPFFFHAGGCQLIGDCLVVPSETGKNESVVSFFDVRDPVNIRELNPALRIERLERDAAAAGVTHYTRDGQEVWLVAVYDSGTVDFYETADLAGGLPFLKTFADKVPEKHHQALPLFTDAGNHVFAIGINQTFYGENDAVLYEVDFVNRVLKPFPERPFSPEKGARLRWGAGVEVVSDGRLVMHCTSKQYRNGCHINRFDTAHAKAGSLVAKKSSRRHSKAKGKRRRRPS